MSRKHGKKEDPRKQIAAIPVRRTSTGGIEILLVTSRTTKRWIVPKGWPIKGLKDWEAAEREALEEAGVAGRIERKAFARYTYWKRMSDHFTLCEVKLFRLEVETQLPDWSERQQRELRWLAPEDAALLVDEPELATAIAALAAQHGAGS